MEKLDMATPDKVAENINRIRELFPNCCTERMDREGKVVAAIDFDLLRQELSSGSVEGYEERYRFEWPGKRESIRLANTPTTQTLRPCRAESVDFDTTQNLYIEGDNLEVLKILRNTYFKKVKMIYIDPPYNTGNDFVYHDKFSMDGETWKEVGGQSDEEGNQLLQRYVRNAETRGSYHSDWCSMIYPRLLVARDLLSDDGVIFISIDDNEVHNLRKICDEVFGAKNFITQFIWVKKKKGSHLSKTHRSMTEYVLSYAKQVEQVELFGEKAYDDKLQPLAKRTNSFKPLVFPKNNINANLPDGEYQAGQYGKGSSALLFDYFEVKSGKIITELNVNGPFVWGQDKLNEEINNGTEVYLSSKFGFNVLRFDQADKIKRPSTLIDSSIKVGTNEDAYAEIQNIFQREAIMSYPKPVSLISYLCNSVSHFDKDSIVLDFFSGSATTAHAVMQLNAEDGGKRKYIMVQLPEETPEGGEARKAGYQNICEIGKERIRRAGRKILRELLEKKPEMFTNVNRGGVKPIPDMGFRVLKLDTSNMADVYYTPAEYKDNLFEGNLDTLEDNIKKDRTEEDLLFQVMLSLGIPLSSSIECEEFAGKKVWSVKKKTLIACFDSDISEEVITAIAKRKPKHFAMRDSSIHSDQVVDNFDQLFAYYSPHTRRRII